MNVKDDYAIQITFDLPIVYKELEIFPVTMKDYYAFNFFATSLVQEKNSIPDVNVISMTYLEFMYKYSTEKMPLVSMFRELLAMALRINSNEIELSYDQKAKPIFIINEKIYNSNDFDNIKLIICEQNLVDIPNEKIQKEIRDKMDEARRLRDKMNGVQMGSLEDLVVSVVASTSMTIEDIYKLSIRKFTKILQRLDLKLHYQIYLSASMSGMVKFKDKDFIKHWLSSLDKKNDFEGTTIGLEQMKSHISFEDLKM